MSARKKYRPRGVAENPLFIAFTGVRLLSKADQAANALRLNMAVDDIDMVNVMSDDRRIMTGADEFVGSVQEAVMTILDRQKATGSKALYPAEIQILRDLVSLWTEILGVVTHHQYFKAQERVAIRVVQAIASKSPKLRVAEPA
jgi:hypothetical protein